MKCSRRQSLVRGKKPAGFSFKLGKAMNVVLLEPPAANAQSARHTFSIVRAPFKNELVIATHARHPMSKLDMQAPQTFAQATGQPAV